MKKALSLFLAILTVIGTVAFAISPQSGLTAEAAEETFQEGSFIYKVADGNAELIKYTDWESTEALVIPETLGGYPVTSIGTNAFSSCNFYSVQLPSTLKNLAIDAFAWLGNSENVLSEIRISGSGYFKVVDNVLLSYAGDILYLYPRNAPETTYTVPKTVLGINYYAFFRVNNLKEITTPVSVQVIGDCAFEQSSIEKVTIGGSLKYLGNSAFRNSSLNEISLPNYIEHFGYDVFTATPFWNNKENYDEDGVLYHQNYLISTLNSEGKEYYEIKDGTRGIAGDAFYWSSLKEVFIPESVFFIGANPFASCKNLEKITVSEENGSFCSDESGSLFSKLKSVFICYPIGKKDTCYVVPQGVEKIEEFAFYGVTNLKNVYLPKSLKRTGIYPFGMDYHASSITDIYYPFSAESWSYIDIAYEEDMEWACVTTTANMHYNSTSYDEHTIISDNGEERICSCGYSTVQPEHPEPIEYDVVIPQYSAPFTYEISNGEATITACDQSAEGVVRIPALLGSYPVKHIAGAAFYGCTKITELILPDGIETIGIGAFMMCSSLSKINLPDSIRSIGKTAFYGTQIAESDSNYWTTYYSSSSTVKKHYVLRIDNHIIEVKGSLNETFEIPEGVITVADRAFLEARGETEIIIPTTLAAFGKNTFNDSATSTTEEGRTIFPDILKFTVSENNPYFSNDEDGVLYNKDKTVLIRYPRAKADTEYTVSDTVTEIADRAFCESHNLKTVIMQEPLVTVGEEAFYNCDSLLNITLPDSVRRIKPLAFYGTLLYNKYAAGNFGTDILYINNHLIDYIGLVKPESLEIKEGTLTIADGSFGKLENIEIDFPESLVTVGDEAFCNMTGFTNPLRISENLTYIGKSAFQTDALIYAFDVDEENPNYSSDEYGVLYNKNKTKLIRYPNLSSLSEYTIPSSVTEIEPYAFAGSKNLKAVKFGRYSQLACINEYTFYGCTSLSIIEFPEALKEIKNQAFAKCSALKNIYFPESLVRLQNSAFSGCSELSEITISGKEIIIENDVFQYSKLETIYFFGTEDDWKNISCKDSKANAANVYCNWSSTTYSLGYYVDGILYEEYKLPKGYQTKAPENPTKEGCDFVSWDKQIPDTMPDESLVFNAIWEAKEYTYTFSYLGVDYVKTFKYGEKITLPEEIDTLAVTGWSGNEIPETMPCKNLKSTAITNQITKSDSFDVTAYHADGTFDEDVTLNVAEISGDREPGGIYMVEGEYYKQVGLYNIKAVNAQSDVIQPNDGYKVTIKLAIPDAYKNRTEFLVYHRFTGGGREQLSTENGTLRVENGYLIFEVSSFSEFEILVASASAKIIKLPDKTTYYYKSGGIDLTGIKLEITNSDGSSKVITDTSLMTVKGFDSSKIGVQTVTVRYGQFSDTFEVKVKYAWWQMIIRVLFLGFFWY